MNRSALAVRSRFDSFTQSARNLAGKAAATATGLAASGMAFAQTDPAAAISTEISGIKTSVGGILVILAAVVGLMLLWSYIRRAK